MVKTVLPGGWGLDTQAFSASGVDVDGLQFAALDTLHDGLAGHAVGQGGLQHGQPALGDVVDEQVADVVGEPMRQGAPGVSCSPAMNPSPSQRGALWPRSSSITRTAVDGQPNSTARATRSYWRVVDSRLRAI
jgi:hypothetical protein